MELVIKMVVMVGLVFHLLSLVVLSLEQVVEVEVLMVMQPLMEMEAQVVVGVQE